MKESGKSGRDDAARQGFHLMAKPAGPGCNLRCEYCFYREKKSFYPEQTAHRMPVDVLDAYTRQYIESQSGPSVEFDWQGGEPTLLGIDFFRQAVEFQKRYGGGKEIRNTLQTNGTLLDDEWCEFLARNSFLVGLSMDGPPSVHDAYRLDGEGKPTLTSVVQALQLMQRHGVAVNILAAVHDESSRHPLEVYRFFRQLGVQFIQFIPIIEREPDAEAEALGISFAPPAQGTTGEASSVMTPWSVRPAEYGNFLIEVFKEWVRNDVGAIFVMNFEWSLAAWAGVGPGVCYLSSRCGRNLILEHNGDIYSCDHFMYPGYRLGNIRENSLKEMVFSRQQNDFGASKESSLPDYCRRCDLLFVCRGGCMKHRFNLCPDGEPGLNYLCEGLKAFYQYIDPAVIQMLEFIRTRTPVQRIMETAFHHTTP